MALVVALVLSHLSRVVGLLPATPTHSPPPPLLRPRWSRNGPSSPTLSPFESSMATTSHLYFLLLLRQILALRKRRIFFWTSINYLIMRS